jgi:hypothetical protein
MASFRSGLRVTVAARVRRLVVEPGARAGAIVRDDDKLTSPRVITRDGRRRLFAPPGST